MSSKIPIGIIGTGFAVRVQIPGFLESGDFDVVAVVSGKEKRAREVAERFGIRHALTDYRAMLALPDVEAVSVVSSPDLHLPMVLDALAAGKHVLCEKPLARDLAEARAMAQAAETARAARRVAMIDHEFRWQPARARMKELVDEGFLGTPYTLSAVSYVGLFADPERPTYSWWQERERGAGWLRNSGSHVIDALRWWFGEIEAVAGFTAINVKQRRRSHSDEWVRTTADDTFGALLRFQCGLQAVIHQTGAAIAGQTNLLHVCGSEGALSIDAQNRLIGGRKGERELRPLEIPERLAAGAPRAPVPGETFTAMEIAPFVCLAREFAAAIAAGETREPSIAEAVKTQEVMEAIELSEQKGRWVDLPLS
ncbi:MAG TPA: Gfo/Idh/MocA family oxidoreductase [Candidatus Bathyarchaeia archaeon]|nr:Gfo/Idh/MocA family oxidoreductase [Candidatus Bathyarchaeia archaeon]